ncbi:MAG: cell division protein FtsK, partial [Candidatus Nealsonbacteria bacterium CG10_big_fil_rev_8_21_14_0_10_37_25]
MERRFDILSSNGSRDVASYNEKLLRLEEAPLPYIVLIIDELADLMASRGREMEAGIVRLAQMARAVGIHLVVATQRPSVEVITGLIKANITSRITFQVASQVDSRTVLDMAGAEKLLGLGDMLFVSAEIIKPKRIQAAYVSEREVKRVVNWLKSK